MEIDKIKTASKKVAELEFIQDRLKEIERADNVDYVSIVRNQSGAPEYSYSVTIRNDKEFLSTIKALIKDKLLRDEKKLLNEIKQI